MANIKKEIEDKFGNRLRARVNGILMEDEKILMIKHRMGDDRVFWNVPGGGMHYGKNAEQNLIREFYEETGLNIAIRQYLFVHEFLQPPLHAIELFFEVKRKGGKLYRGIDPEMHPDLQVIEDIQFLDISQINQIPNEDKHAVFWGIKSINDIRIWKGYFNFENKCIK
ncbi:NUDIX domain-containing protein [Negadavirga shengliensis]|uniref:NUDIX domain-containing protein n=1 Tax=Negadavirga shengliensis TaxID=1389218 RepID=A0ABV9T4X6_9BACT